MVNFYTLLYKIYFLILINVFDKVLYNIILEFGVYVDNC